MSIEAVTEAIQENIAGFNPQTRDEFDQFLKGLPAIFTELGAAFAAVAEKVTDRHVHSTVIDALRELGAVAGSLADHADQVYQAHTSAHEMWLND